MKEDMKKIVDKKKDLTTEELLRFVKHLIKTSEIKQTREILKIAKDCTKLSIEMTKRQAEIIKLYKEVIDLKKEVYGIDNKELEKQSKTIH